MFLQKKQEKAVEDFWREYETKTGEKVLERVLGQYLSGWDTFGNEGGSPLWGLAIVTSGGFRFHHFARQNWITAMLRGLSSAEDSAEKTLFIPKEHIISAELHSETKWWKKLFFPALPVLAIHYRAGESTERELVIQVEHTALLKSLSKFLTDRYTSEDSV